MDEARLKILKMLEEQKISVEEAVKLLEAMADEGSGFGIDVDCCTGEAPGAPGRVKAEVVVNENRD